MVVLWDPPTGGWFLGVKLDSISWEARACLLGWLSNVTRVFEHGALKDRKSQSAAQGSGQGPRGGWRKVRGHHQRHRVDPREWHLGADQGCTRSAPHPREEPQGLLPTSCPAWPGQDTPCLCPAPSKANTSFP